uniref:Broad-complex core protein isoform 6 n=1 Tax=Caligus rogercresseyi TaxID=217165 RepID=C1BPC4_CALRO|nr:Broad-complex core protein isoform 6 [Caligus rogercresseyi]
MSSSSEFLCLRWNAFESNIKSVFSGLRLEEEFSDVSLACGSKVIKAHRLILSAFSPTLRAIIKSLPRSQHPILYLRNVQFKQLEALMSFMYNGEVNVHAEDLDDFLAIAEELQVRGLAGGEAQNITQEESKSTNISTPTNKKSLRPDLIDTKVDLEEKEASLQSIGEEEDDNECLEGFDGENEGEQQDFPEDYVDSSEFQDMDQSDYEISEASRSHNHPSDGKKDLLDVRIMRFVSTHRNNKGNFKCLKCSYETPRLMDLKRHIESKHFVTDGFPCEACGFRSKTRYGLYRHRTRNHRMDPEYYSTI